MATKIQVSITKDTEHGGTDAGMLDAYRRLLAIGEFPTKGLVLTIECGDQDAQGIRDEIAVALTERAVGIDVKIKRTQEEEVDRRRMVAVSSVPTATPMERVWRGGDASRFSGDGTAAARQVLDDFAAKHDARVVVGNFERGEAGWGHEGPES